MSKHDNKFKFEDDDDDEIFEYVGLLLLITLPIVVIYGLCVYFCKQKQLAIQRETELRNEILTSRMQSTSSDRCLTIYTVPVNQQNISTCPNCSFQLTTDNPNQQSDSTLPTYDQIQNRRSSHEFLSKPT